MGLGAVSYALAIENKPAKVIVTDIDDAKLARANEVISCPVSYTHLDVYKRQARGSVITSKIEKMIENTLYFMIILLPACMVHTDHNKDHDQKDDG